MDRPTVSHTDWLDGVRGLGLASVDMLYADPPFNTGVKKKTPVHAQRAGRGVHAAYADSWSTTGAYISWLRERLVATLPLLKTTGNVLIHCDWRASHHIRLMLDDVLGPDQFVNHLVWHYGLGGSSPRGFARKHDDILFYRVRGSSWFEAPRVPATSRRMAGQTKKATDVLEIPSLNNMSKERTGYPTQKPLALLDVLVRACCPPGGVVLDPCCGSGTTLVAATTAGRRAIGFDQSDAAIVIARARIERAWLDRSCRGRPSPVATHG